MFALFVRCFYQGALSLALTLLCLHSVHAQDDVEKRLDRLEKQVQQILDALKSHGLIDSKISPQSPAIKLPPSTALRHAGYADIRYYVSESVLGASPPVIPPIASGHIALGEQIDLQPKTYQASKGGIFSAYRDPSRYRAAGLWLEAQLSIMQPGLHRFSIVTQPAREGGSAVTATETVRLWLNDRLLFGIDATPKWHSWSKSLDLTPGLYTVKLWFNSVSPGFGVTAIDSSLLLKLQRPGDVSPIPLEHFFTVPNRPQG